MEKMKSRKEEGDDDNGGECVSMFYTSHTLC